MPATATREEIKSRRPKVRRAVCREAVGVRVRLKDLVELKLAALGCPHHDIKGSEF